MMDDIELIADHKFPRTRDAVCQGKRHDGTPCLCAWDDIRDCTHDDVGKPNIAHIGNSTLNEINEIVARRAREDAAWMAVVGVAAK